MEPRSQTVEFESSLSTQISDRTASPPRAPRTKRPRTRSRNSAEGSSDDWFERMAQRMAVIVAEHIKADMAELLHSFKAQIVDEITRAMRRHAADGGRQAPSHHNVAESAPQPTLATSDHSTAFSSEELSTHSCGESSHRGSEYSTAHSCFESSQR